MKKHYYLIGICLLLVLNGIAQNRVKLEYLSQDNFNHIRGEDLNLSPGDTIVIPTGSYAGIRFYDIVGLPGMPITITNEGGQVILTEELYSALEFYRSSYVHVTGSGSDDVKYGFRIESLYSHSQGINLTNFTSDVEIDFVHVAKAGFAGIMAKTDPSCGYPETFRSSGFVMKNINIHHNKIRNVGGEGVYIGHTGSSITSSFISCDGIPVFGHWLENVSVNNNRISSTGRDAIQLNLVRFGGVISNNRITSYAKEGEYFQDFAMSIGGGEYQIFNNSILNKAGQNGKGIQFLNGFSGSKIFNNVLVNPRLYGIFIHNRVAFDQNEGYLIANNTIINPELAGIRYNTVITQSTEQSKIGTTQDLTPTFFVNNVIVDPGNNFEDSNTWKGNEESFIDFNDKSTRDAILPFINNNLFSRDIESIGFKNIQKNNFRPNDYQSLLVDEGTNLSDSSIDFDFRNEKRISGEAIDIGAFELKLSSLREKALNRLEVKSELETAITVFPNPATSYFSVNNTFKDMGLLQLFNEQGLRVLHIKNYLMGSTVDISGLKSGTYYLNIRYVDKSRDFGKLVVN